MVLEQTINCYRPYYAMFVYPFKGNKTLVCTCFCNTFKRENSLIIDKEIRQVWNSKQFRFQRLLVSSKDWHFCKGASCEFYNREEELAGSNIIKNAINNKKTRLDYFPLFLNLSPSFACNNNCYFCCNAAFRKEGILRLKGDTMKEIKQYFVPYAEWIAISGGEPFVAPESIELINWVLTYYPQKELSVLTNGTLLHNFGLQKIIQSNMKLKISLFGMSRGTYIKNTQSNNYDKVFENINQLISLRFKKMILVFLLNKDNISDLENFYKFIEKNEDTSGIVQTEMFAGRKLWNAAYQINNKYPHLSEKIKFNNRNEGLLKRITRRLYNPFHFVRYCFANI
jgi:MoaA/NifB/PqqE/SkfB family radical SAM enzyme